VEALNIYEKATKLAEENQLEGAPPTTQEVLKYSFNFCYSLFKSKSTGKMLDWIVLCI
jgi:hypothetical protein